MCSSSEISKRFHGLLCLARCFPYSVVCSHLPESDWLLLSRKGRRLGVLIVIEMIPSVPTINLLLF